MTCCGRTPNSGVTNGPNRDMPEVPPTTCYGLDCACLGAVVRPWPARGRPTGMPRENGRLRLGVRQEVKRWSDLFQLRWPISQTISV